MIVRALATKPAVLMLDEPTASLSGAEVAQLFRLLKRLKASGATMIFITHRLPEVIALCDRATVLRDGRVAARARPRRISTRSASSPRCRASACSASIPHHDAPVGAPTLLKVEHLLGDGAASASTSASMTSVSNFAPARSSASPGCSAPGRSELLGALYGAIPAQWADRGERQGDRDRFGPRCPTGRHRAPDRGPQALRPAYSTCRSAATSPSAISGSSRGTASSAARRRRAPRCAPCASSRSRRDRRPPPWRISPAATSRSSCSPAC